MISHITLTKAKKLSESIILKTDSQDYEFIIVEHPKFDAAFTLHGGQLIHFQNKQKVPLIYLSETAIFNDQKAIRGGVPICWPWFAKPTKKIGEHLSFHGFARINKWAIETINEDKNGVDIDFVLTSNKITKAIWNHDFKLTLKVTLNNSITLSLITENTGSKAFKYGGALHTYLNIKDIQQCNIVGLAEEYTDSLDAGKSKKATSPITINGELDAIHQMNQGPVIVTDIANRRKIMVTNSGNNAVVAWNPWVNKAKNIEDMPNNGYKKMLCIESTITSQDAITVTPGQTHKLSTSIKETTIE